MSASIFELCLDLESSDLESILLTLKVKPEIHFLENFLANRLLYPQTVATTKQEISLDFAMVKQAIKKRPQKIYDPNLKKIVLPKGINYFGNLKKSLPSILEILNLDTVVPIFLETTLIGTIITLVKNNKGSLELLLNDQVYQLKPNSLSLIETTDKSAHIKLQGFPELIVPGGEFGIAIDARERQNANR